MLNKPPYYACITEDKEYPSVLNLIKDQATDRTYYFANTLGPLETGLVLLSNDIRWTSRLNLRLQKKSCIYHITLANDINEDHIKNLSEILEIVSSSHSITIKEILNSYYSIGDIKRLQKTREFLNLKKRKF